MRPFIYRLITGLLTFIFGVSITLALTLVGDRLDTFLSQPSESIPAPCDTPESVNSGPCSSQTMTEAEQYAIYSMLITRMNQDRPALFVIRDHPEVPQLVESYLTETFQELSRSHPSIESSTFESFRVNNSISHPLKNLFRLSAPSVVISQREVEGYFAKEIEPGWAAFYKKYPGSNGFITLSKIGFNPEMTQALVYYGQSCGGLCGQGSIIFLVKEGGVWKIKGSGGAWVS